MELVRILKTLSDDTRLRLINILFERELNVNGIVEIMGMNQSRISHHLNILKRCGLVVYRRQGNNVFYRACRLGKGGRINAIFMDLYTTEIQ